MEGFIEYASINLEVDHRFAWNLIFSSLIYNIDMEIDVEEHLFNVDHQILKAYMYIYSMNSYVNTAMKNASIEKDKKKVKHLGPFAYIICRILEGSHKRRNSIIGRQLNMSEPSQDATSLSSIEVPLKMCTWLDVFVT